MRFEIACSNEADEKSESSSTKEHPIQTECLNLSLYDQSDPTNLYLATIDHRKFKKLMGKQNLMIEQFSQLGGHIQLLLDSCIIKLPDESQATGC